MIVALETRVDAGDGNEAWPRRHGRLNPHPSAGGFGMELAVSVGLAGAARDPTCDVFGARHQIIATFSVPGTKAIATPTATPPAPGTNPRQRAVTDAALPSSAGR